MHKNVLEKSFNYIDQWLRHKEMNFDFPGISIAIASQNDVLYKKGFGLSNLEASEKMHPEHVFRYASHSKTFTAVSVLQLADQNKINLDDRISDYLRFLNPNDIFTQQATIRQLLSHSAGIRRDDSDSSYWLGQKDFPSSDKMKNAFQHYTAKIENNTAFNYSNLGYALLGFLIEEISGISFSDYVDQFISTPLKLSSVGIDKEASVTGYTTKFKGNRRPLKNTPSTGGTAPAAGISGTPADVALFYAKLLSKNTSLFGRETQKEMRKPLWSIPQCGDQKYGFGLIFENGLIGHNGNFLGQTTSTFFDPKKELAISVAINTMNAYSMEFVKGINHILNFFQGKETHLTDESLEHYNSTLYNIWGPSTYTAIGQNLYCTDPGYMFPFKDPTILSPIKNTPNAFLVGQDNGYGFTNEIVQFSFSEDGKVLSSNYGGYESITKEAFEKAR